MAYKLVHHGTRESWLAKNHLDFVQALPNIKTHTISMVRGNLLDQKRLIPCYAGRLNLVLTETGEVYPCEILSTSFGNVRDHHYNMKEIVRTEQAQPVLESIENKRCYCTHECYFITNILFNPRLYPSLRREYVQIQSG